MPARPLGPILGKAFRSDYHGEVVAALSINLLGGFELHLDGEPVDLRSKKARALVAFLALQPDTQHSREQLAALLWGDMPDERARHNLRQCVSALRTSIGEAALRVDGDCLSLDPEVVAVDALELAASDDSEVAAGLYRGELLAGFHLVEEPFEEWLGTERARYRQRACEHVGRLARTQAKAGEVDAAIELARRQIEIEPASEEGHRLLMELYEQTGRRSAALRQYKQCAQALERYIGAVPSADTNQLYHRLSDPEDMSCASPPSQTLQTIDDAPALPDKPSIAVMPFSIAGDSEEDRYFGIGLAEDIVIALSRFSALFVISALASYTYRERDWDVREVGRELGVQYIAHGSVRRAGDRLRVTVQLVDAQAGRQLWGQRYDRELADVFDVQEDIARTIVCTLVSRVEAAALQCARNKSPASLAAYEYLLRGKYHHHLWTADDNIVAIELFAKAVELDSDYALAYAWHGCAVAQQSAFTPSPDLLPRAFELVSKAHALDATEAECQRIFGAYYMIQNDLEKSEPFQRRALELNPNDDRIVCQTGELEMFLGRPAEGEKWVRMAMRLNPYHPDSYWFHLGRTLFHQSKYDEAYKVLRRVSKATPRVMVFQAAAAIRTDHPEDAARSVAELLEKRPHATAASIVDGAPYRRSEDAQQLADALADAGLPRV